MDMNKEFRGLSKEQRLYKDRVRVRQDVAELLSGEDKAIMDEAFIAFEGDARELERAVGALLVGKYFGWRVLRIMHDGSTYAKYEKVLGAGAGGFKFRDHCPERGPLARRSHGLQLADRIDGFWRVVRGQVPGARSSEVEVDPQLPDSVG